MKSDYIDINQLKKIFKIEQVTLKLRTISVNGQKRGCSGFVIHKNGRIVYIDTEPYFNGGLFEDKNQEIMYRAADNIYDYSGKINHWTSLDSLKEEVMRLLEGSR